MRYTLGWVIINSHKAPAIFWEDGRTESGPLANRLHKEAGL